MTNESSSGFGRSSGVDEGVDAGGVVLAVAVGVGVGEEEDGSELSLVLGGVGGEDDEEPRDL